MAAHRYWRFRCTAGGAGVFALAELQGHIVNGGVNVFTGGTPINSSNFGGAFVPANAFDNNISTAWASATGAVGEWIGYDLGAGVTKDIIELVLICRNDANFSQAPTGGDVQFSDDSVTWTTYWSPTLLAWSAAGQSQTVNNTPPPTPQIRVTAADVLVATTSKSPEMRLTAGDVLVALNFPSPQERTSWAAGLVTVKSTIPLRVTNAAVLVAVRGRISNPKLRAWTFTLDGHDFYVLRLGTKLTLVYDVYSGEWVDWDAFSEVYWPVLAGINWVGGTGILDSDGSSFNSNVLVGDDTYGLLWFLDPKQPYDESPELLAPAQQVFFERVLQGQMPIVGRQNLPCYSLWITADMGSPAYVGAGVQLEISDDAGNSYDDMGIVTVTPGEVSPELSWYSLGQIEAPGRLFRITDDGAVARIDGMEMNDPDDK